MPKATVNTKSGAVITIEGTQEELVSVLAKLQIGEVADDQSQGRPPRRAVNGIRPTPAHLLGDLMAEGFFGEPRDLGAIRVALREKGHFYPATTLSPLMLRLVRKKELRRIKDKKHWAYVG